MDFVESLNLLGVKAKEIPSLKGSGSPTEATVGAVGCLYMNTDTGDLYKCIAADNGVYTWLSINNKLPKYELIEKIIVGYSITTSVPEDWETNYTSYFKNTGTLQEPVYTALAELEEWEEGKYFSYSSDDVTITVIDTEPDGTEFCFNGVILDVNFPAASSNRNLVYELRSASGTAMTGALYNANVSNAIKTTSSWYQACIESHYAGIWTGVQNVNYAITPIISRHIPRFEPMRAIRFSGTSFPAGSTITIYGVR